MHKIFYFALAFHLFISCSNDEDATPFFELSCLGTPIESNNLMVCDSFVLSPQQCDVVHVGDYKLAKDSRSYLNQYCLEIGDKEVFVNSNGDKLYMEVYAKNFTKTIAARNTFINCDNDTTKFITACYGNEYAQFNMRSADSKIDLLIRLRTSLSTEDPLSGKAADYIEILQRTANNLFLQEFSIIINERDIGFNQEPSQENLGTIELLGESFENVLSYNISAFTDPKPFKYYYNQTIGLIAFQDSEGVLWRLEL
ncbi:MAG: hypothetical protein R2825_17715 [Saprospiraceae bacterium]